MKKSLKLICHEPQEIVSSFRLSSPSPPPPSVLNEPISSEFNERASFSFSQSTQSALNSRKDTTSNTAYNPNAVANTASNVKKMPKSSMTRSTTEGFISSLTHSNNNRSSLIASTLKEEFTPSGNSRMMSITQRPLLNMEKKFEKLKLDNSTKYKLKNRYTVDFLLQRADTINSKKQPANWKELSEKYPNVCFSGKVY